MPKDLLFKLVSIPSINSTQGEIKIAEFIYEYIVNIKKSLNISDENYWIFLQEIKDDDLKRKNVICVLKGNKDVNNKAIVMLGHFDTVDVEDYGNLKNLAFDPLLLKQEFKKIFPHIVNEDTEFGRGIFDMKSGIVVNIEVLKRLAENIDKWSGFVIFLFVCDEEGDSKGMLNSLYFLRQFKKENNIEYLFCLDTDYTTEKAIYLGSIGKVLVGIFVKGIETHVGQSLEGLNSNYILASILSKIDDNIDLVEFSGNQFTSPPVVMKVRDLRESYNVKTNLFSFAYINHLFFEESLENILLKYKKIVEDVVKTIKNRREELVKRLKIPINVEDIKVYTLSEFFEKYKGFVYKDYGVLDYRESLILSLKEWISNLSIAYPFVLIFFLPPYYPSVKTSKNIKEEIIDYLNKIDEKIEVFNYFPYISDLSFLGKIKDVGVLESNMLGWKENYYLDVELINEVSMPCVDWGVWGADAHKFTERVFVNYSLLKLPNYITGLIYKFLR